MIKTTLRLGLIFSLLATSESLSELQGAEKEEPIKLVSVSKKGIGMGYTASFSVSVSKEDPKALIVDQFELSLDSWLRYSHPKTSDQNYYYHTIIHLNKLRKGDVMPLGSFLYRVSGLSINPHHVEITKLDSETPFAGHFRTKTPFVLTPLPKGMSPNQSGIEISWNRDKDNILHQNRLVLRKTSLVKEKDKLVPEAEVYFLEVHTPPQKMVDFSTSVWHKATVRVDDVVVIDGYGFKVVNILTRDEKKGQHPWIEFDGKAIMPKEVIKQKIVGVPFKKVEKAPEFDQFD